MVCGFGTATDPPLEWRVAFGRSSCLPPKLLMLFRLVLALVFIGHFAWHFSVYFKRDGWYYFIYLTHWSFMLETIYVVSLPAMTWLANRPLNTESGFQALWYSHRNGAGPQPWFASAAMAYFMIIQPLSLWVTLSYWTAEKPIWQFCDLNGGVEPCYSEWPSYLGFFVHLWDWLYLFISFLLGLIPYRFSNCAWLLVFVVLYWTWTYVHFYLKIGRSPHFEQTCLDNGYTLNECPIYFAVDWHHPAEAFKSVAGALASSVVAIFVYRGMDWARDRVSESCCGGKPRSLAIGSEEAEADRHHVWDEAAHPPEDQKNALAACSCCGR
uniref:Uncharacterized protein n=1 Tax=Zooxanthella nutricula TaxID=1333877 RepID=A0A7S2LB35_9DINO